MNQVPENDEADAIRSEIDTTRRRMDDTMDALGDRLKGRHLLDEILGFFRSDNSGSNGKAAELKEKISETASSAARSVADTVKANPLPLLLIGAGVAWMIYSSGKESSRDRYADEDDGATAGYDPDASYDRPLDYPTPAGAERGFGESDSGFSIGGTVEDDFSESSGPSKLEQVKLGVEEKAQNAKEQVKERISHVGDAVREKSQAISHRAREVGSRVQARTREVYARTRQTVVRTADEHPLELGLACLAAGVAAGLALPTPERLNRLAGPSMDRLRQRTRDTGKEYLEKGKRVVSAAGNAVKNEAQAQGLTFDRLRNVAERAKDAATESAQREGLTPGSGHQNQNPSGQSVSPGQPGREMQDSGMGAPSQAQTSPAANAGRGI